MANEYTTLDKFKSRLMNKTNSNEDGDLGDILEAASRAVDDYLKVTPGYFIAPNAASTKKIKGTGLSYIQLTTPIYGAVTILAPSGYTAPNFDYLPEEQRLITLTEDDNPTPYIVWDEVYYSINAFWGYSAIPAQIREATLQLATHFYRGRDKSLTGTITDMRQDEQFPERDYPRQTRRLLDEFKIKLGGNPNGGLYLA